MKTEMEDRRGEGSTVGERMRDGWVSQKCTSDLALLVSTSNVRQIAPAAKTDC
jgi:hypothetical protein